MKLTEEECKRRWEAASAEKPLRLDDEGMQVMKWLEHELRKGVKRGKPFGWVSGINK